MANPRQWYELIDAGLEVLVAGLRPRILPYSQQDRFKNDREQFLQAAAHHIETYQGVNSPACALGQWCLQTHRWLQTRARGTSLTPEIALCDLERMQALAAFLGLDGVKDDLQVFVAHAAAQTDGGDFAAANGGYESLAALFAAAAAAFRQRLAELAPPFDPDAAPPDEAWRLLADGDFMGRYLIDGSRDRLEQCLALAQMALILRDFLDLDLDIPPQAAIADAQRLGYLGELLGIERWPRPAADARMRPPAAPVGGVSDAPAQAEGLVIDLSAAADAARDAGDQEAQTDEPPTRSPASAPAADLDAEAFPAPQAAPPDGARSSGVMRLALTLCVAAGSVALLTFFVARPPSIDAPFATWWQTARTMARTLWPGGDAAGAVVPEVAEAAPPVPTPTLVTVADILQPTATFTPIPTPSAVPPSARVDLALYAWPHAQAATVGSIARGTAVAPVRIVRGAEQNWLDLDNGFVLAEGVQDQPADLPVIDWDDMDEMPSFAASSDELPAAASGGAAVVTQPAFVYLCLPRVTDAIEARCDNSNKDITPALADPTLKVVKNAIADRYDQGDEITPVGICRDAERDWLKLDNKRFILAQVVDNVPDNLPREDADATVSAICSSQ